MWDDIFMRFKDVEIRPRVLPEKTLLMLKCLEYKYAKAFIDTGAMKFATPSSWKPDGTTRGDVLEGVYASQRGCDKEQDRFLKSLRKAPYTVRQNGFTFYKSKPIVEYRAYCLYGLNSDNMHMQTFRSQDHRFHKVGCVKKEFFQKLYPGITKESIDAMGDERPAVLIITPDKFCERVASKLIGMGLRKEEILIGPVFYTNNFRKPFIIFNEPEELFSKDISYSEQSEIRIAVDTRRDEVRELFEKTNGIIEIGPVDESIATLSEFYFEDMTVEERDNKLLFNLARPQHYDYIDDVSLIVILQQALSDEMPEAPMSIEAIEDTMDKILNLLRQRDPDVLYDKKTNFFRFKGIGCDLGSKAAYKMLEHYNNYVIDGDFEGAGAVVEKFKHFFPKYDMGNYFGAYYKHVRDED